MAAARPRHPLRSAQPLIAVLDLDCFYAAVHLRAKPHLADKPVAIVQKHLCITANYIARRPENGALRKGIPVSDALALCPQLVLIDGSDLTPFRAASREVIAATRSFLSDHASQLSNLLGTPVPVPPLQRHGFDELFLDLSALVSAWQTVHSPPPFLSGHLHPPRDPNTTNVPDAFRSAAALVHAVRGHIVEHTQLTVSAGLSTSRLLAKLAVGQHKPDAQTTLLPSDAGAVVSSLSPRSLLGIGATTERQLHSAANSIGGSVHTTAALLATFAGPDGRLALSSALGGNDQADRILALCRGEDDSVVSEGVDAPRSISVEDGCRNCTTMMDVRRRVDVLTERLLALLREDGELYARAPRTLAVGVRRRAEGWKTTWRRGRMPVEVISVCRSRGVQGDGVHCTAAVAVRKRALSVLREAGGVFDGAKFELTLLGLGAGTFVEGSGPGEASGFFTTAKRQRGEGPVVEVKREDVRCPICQSVLSGNNVTVNMHIDRCLGEMVNNDRDAKKRKMRTSSQTLRVDSFFKKNSKKDSKARPSGQAD